MAEQLKIALGKTRESHDVKNVEMSWPELVAAMGKPVVDHMTQAEYMHAPIERQLAAKDKGYYVTGWFNRGVRKKENIHTRNPIVLDIDHGPPETLDRIIESLGHLRWIVTSTRKDTVAKPRLRIAFLMSRPVNPTEYGACARRLASWVDPQALEWFDDTGFEFSRVMFWPSVGSDQDFVFHHNEGAPIDVDYVLSTYDDFHNIAEWPVSTRQADKIREQGKKIGNPLTKPGVIGAFNRTYDIEQAMEKFIPGVYVAGSTPGRMSYAAGSSRDGAVIYDDGLALYSHHETDPCYYQCVNAFDMVRIHLFSKLDAKVDKGTPINLRPSYERMEKFALEDSDVSVDYAAAKIDYRAGSFDDYVHEVDEQTDDYEEPEATAAPQIMPLAERPKREVNVTPNAPSKTDAELTKECAARLKMNDRGAIVANLSNAETILLLDPMFKRAIAFNQFSRNIMLMRGIPGVRSGVGLSGVTWEDSFDIQMRSLIERKYGVSFGKELMHDAVVLVSGRYAFHPVKELLEGLPAWDGVPRLDTFFVDHYGSENSAYMRAVTRKWFVAAVARIYEPGCKFDHMIVLEGKEGKLKSLVMKILFYDFFTDGVIFGLTGREVIERTSGFWCCEISEMVTRSSATVEENKAFVSRQKETARLSYGRYASHVLRSFVLFGSTNELRYLMSLTGNRRFWSIAGDGRSFDPDLIRAIRDQLWAEVLVRYHDGEPIWLEDQDVIAEAMEQQAQRTVHDDWYDLVSNWLDQPIASDYWDTTDRGRVGATWDEADETSIQRDRVGLLEIWQECIGGTIDKYDRRASLRLAAIMALMPGWKESSGVRFGVRYGRGRGYMRTIEVSPKIIL